MRDDENRIYIVGVTYDTEGTALSMSNSCCSQTSYIIDGVEMRLSCGLLAPDSECRYAVKRSPFLAAYQLLC
jgi:hypothetical protein